MSEGDNQSRRNFLTKTMTLVGVAGAGAVVFPLVSSMAPSEKAKAAGAPVKVDISNLNEGEKIDVIWRKKPIWIIKRSKEMIDSIDTIAGKYKDPNSSNKEQQPEFANNKYRSLKPEILVLEGVFHDEFGQYPKGSWIRTPHLSKHTPFTKEEGALIFVKTGHLK